MTSGGGERQSHIIRGRASGLKTFQAWRSVQIHRACYLRTLRRRGRYTWGGPKDYARWLVHSHRLVPRAQIHTNPRSSTTALTYFTLSGFSVSSRLPISSPSLGFTGCCALSTLFFTLLSVSHLYCRAHYRERIRQFVNGRNREGCDTMGRVASISPGRLRKENHATRGRRVRHSAGFVELDAVNTDGFMILL